MPIPAILAAVGRAAASAGAQSVAAQGAGAAARAGANATVRQAGAAAAQQAQQAAVQNVAAKAAGSGAAVPPPPPPGTGYAGATPPPLPPGGGSPSAAPNYKPNNGSQVMGLVQSVLELKDEGTKLAKDMVGKPFEKAAKYADMGKSAVQNDVVGMIEQIDALPDGVKKFARALDGLTAAIVDRGRELGKFDGRLATTNAQATVRKLQSDMREANYVSESYSKVTEARSKLDEKIVDILNPIKDAVALIAKDALDVLNEIAGFIRDNIKYVVAGIELLRAIAKAATLNVSDAVDIIRNIDKKIDEAMRKQRGGNTFLQDVFRNSEAENRRNERRPVPRPGPADLGMNFAAFG